MKTLAAYGRAYKFIDGPSSKQEWIKAYREGVGPDSETMATGLWDWIQETKAFNTAIVLSPERINYMQELNVALGVQKAILPFDRVADMSIARDAAILAGKGPV